MADSFVEQMNQDCGLIDTGPEPDPNAPETEPVDMTARQQIRAKALECAVVGCNGTKTMPEWEEFQHMVRSFETYIREGK